MKVFISAQEIVIVASSFGVQLSGLMWKLSKWLSCLIRFLISYCSVQKFCFSDSDPLYAWAFFFFFFFALHLLVVKFGILYSIWPDIGPGVRVFANGPGDLGSIPGRVIPKTQKMVLDASLLNTQHYKVRIKGKVEQSREGVAPSPTPWCSSYRKGSLRVTLDYGPQLYLTYLYSIRSTMFFCLRLIQLAWRILSSVA